MSKSANNDIFKSTVLGHPSGLFVLFFTEMWERFSYYGMRGILVLFLISSIGIGGWDWTSKEALALYGTYTAMVYLTPILGGYLADKHIGYRKAVIWGALIMTLGHASMAMEFANMFLYIGIGLLIIGNGLFKPNMTSIISYMYEDTPEKKDGAYTIFYMGVNAGAFLGILLCGYIGEKVSWSYGFGLAGIFMLMGALQFYLAQGIFGDIGLAPKGIDEDGDANMALEFEGDRLNPFTQMDKILMAIAAFIGITWILNDPLSKIGGINLLEFGETDFAGYYILIGVILFLGLLVSRIIRYPVQTRDRMVAIVIFAVMTVCFWACFEQAGGSMTIFANNYTGRVMSDSWATIFNIGNIIITVVPMAIITWVLIKLFRQTFDKYKFSNIVLGSSFLIIWVLIFWMINRNLSSNALVVDYQTIESVETNAEGQSVTTYTNLLESMQASATDKIVNKSTTVIEPGDIKVGDKISLIETKKDKFIYLNPEKADHARKVVAESGKKSPIIQAEVKSIKENEVEIPATWFGILNSLFIIMFAPLFSKWWESKYNPSAASKYGLGLILLGVGFGALAFGSMGIESGAEVATVSIIWLILAYLFHTLGELCLSPVALSYISKLVPGRMIALMFGIWYIAVAIGNKTAGEMGGRIEEITSEYSLTTFFLIFTIVPIALGLLGIMLNPVVKKLMHGVK
ncbi:MAG: POT family proton-dependent oligopeptide transporter [Gammaproteobacteria bacterium]|jgi:POT family proton-dependent oligopeptide transporter